MIQNTQLNLTALSDHDNQNFELKQKMETYQMKLESLQDKIKDLQEENQALFLEKATQESDTLLKKQAHHALLYDFDQAKIRIKQLTESLEEAKKDTNNYLVKIEEQQKEINSLKKQENYLN